MAVVILAGALLVASLAGATSGQNGSRTFTTDVDFDEGTYDNVVHYTSGSLQLDDTRRVSNVLWAVGSGNSNVLKIDADTGAQLAEYRLMPAGWLWESSNNTAVDSHGNLWVATTAQDPSILGYQTGSVVKIGLAEAGQCADRNDNGVIDTSTGPGDVRLWLGDGFGVQGVGDECILESVRIGSYPSQMVVDSDDNLWAISSARHVRDRTARWNKISPDGEILRIIPCVVDCRTFDGASFDSKGRLWAVGAVGQSWADLLRLDTRLADDDPNLVKIFPAPAAIANLDDFGYQLAVGRNDHIWVTGYTSGKLQEFNDEGVFLSTHSPPNPGGYANDIVVSPFDGNIWADTYAASGVGPGVRRFDQNGNQIAFVRTIGSPNGLDVDGEGRVWVMTLGSTGFKRIDPVANRVDLTVPLTGSQVPYGGGFPGRGRHTSRAVTQPPVSGSWSVVHNSGQPGFEWGRIDWNAEIPDGASLTVTAQSSDDGVSFGPREVVTKNQDLSLSDGRYLKIAVDFTRSSTGESPVLNDITVGGANTPPVAAAGSDQVVDEGSIVMLDGSASIDPDGDPLEFRWDRVTGTGPAAVLSSTADQKPSYEALDDSSARFELNVSDGRESATDETNVSVRNVAPAVSAADASAYAGSAAIVAANFSDPGVLDTHTASVDWGDGTPLEDAAITQGAGWGSLVGAHRYAAAGSYEVIVKVTDDDGAQGTATAQFAIGLPPVIWANRNTDSSALDITGSGNFVTGRVHSNGDLKIAGSSNTIDGDAEYASDLINSGSDNTVTGQSLRAARMEPPINFALADYRPGGPVSAAVSPRYFDHTSACTSGVWMVTGPLPDGVHYSPCGVEIAASNLSATVTIASEREIKVSGSSNRLTAYHDGLLFLSPSTANAAIHLSGSSSSYAGIANARSGQIHVAGSSVQLTCSVIGDRIKLSGSGIKIHGSACVRPSSAVAIASFVPSPVLDLSADKPEALPGDTVHYTAGLKNDGGTLVASGLMGAENVAPATAEAAYLSYTLEYREASTGLWVPLAGTSLTAPGYAPREAAAISDGVELVAHPAASPGVTYQSSGTRVIGTQIAPGGLAAWGYQARITLTAEQARKLFDPSVVSEVRNVVHLEFLPGASQVRELYRYGSDFAAKLRSHSPELQNATLSVAPPDGQPTRFDSATIPELAGIQQGRRVEAHLSHALAPPAARSAVEPADTYLQRLARADGQSVRAVARARAGSSYGLLLVPPQNVGTKRRLPVLSIEKFGPLSATAGDTVGFDTALKNNGSATAEALTVNDWLTSGEQTVLTDAQAALSPGQSKGLHAAYDLPTGRTGPLGSNASVAWKDANGNSYGPVEDGYTLDVQAPPQISVKKTAQLAEDADQNGQITPGDTLSYRILATNISSGPATGAVFTDMPSGGLSLVGASATTSTGLITEGQNAGDSRLRVDLGTLAGGSSATITFRARIDDPLTIGDQSAVQTVTNQGKLTCDQIGEVLTDDPSLPGSSNPTATTVAPRAPSITAAKAVWLQTDADADEGTGAGDALGYEITVKNQGTLPATNVVLTDAPGIYSRLLTGTVTATGGVSVVTQGNAEADSSLRVEISSLLPGQSVTTRFQARIEDPLPAGVGLIANQGQVTSDQLTPVATYDQNTGAPGPTIMHLTPPPLPVAAIGSPTPADGQTITHQTDIQTQITAPPGQSVSLWCVKAGPVGGTKKTLACGSGETGQDQTLATFDPTTLENGPYEITVTATTSNGASDSRTISVAVEGALKPGRYTTTYQDLSIPIHSLPIQVLRTYDSFKKSKGDFGVGWNVEIANFEVISNHSFGDGGWYVKNTRCLNVLGQNVCLAKELANDTANFTTVRWPDGHTETFDFKPDSGASVYYDARAAFTPRRGATSTLEVDGDPYLTYYNDQDLYDATGTEIFTPKRFKLTAKDGTVYHLDTGKGLTKAEDRHGNSLTVDEHGITSSTGKSVAFTRDSQDRITKITGPSGQQTTYAYDAAGDLTAATDARANTMRFTYDTEHNLLVTNDPANRPTRTVTYDQNGRMDSVTDGTGHTTQIATDDDAQRQVITSPDGRLTSITAFDGRGNLTELRELFDGSERSTTYAYDANDNLVRSTDPLGHATSSTYDASGNQTSTTDARGNTTRYEYDAANQLTKQTLPDGETTTITRDAFESPTKIDRAGGRVTDLAYDADGLLTSVTDPLGRSVSFTHDAAGNTTQQQTPSGSTAATYDAANHIKTRTDAVGATTRFNYDPDGNLTKVADANGGAQSYDYDYLGRLLSETDQLGHTTTYAYDAAGRVSTRTDRNGRTENFVYDANGKLTSKTQPDGNNTQITYDGAGRPQVMKNADTQLNFAYNAADQITNATSTGVSGSPQPTTSIDYAYDAAGNRTSLTRAAQVTSYAYDSLNRLSGVTDASGGNFGITRDTLGRIKQMTRPNGVNTNYIWDAADQVKDIVHAASAGILDEDHYSYNSSGLRTAVTDHNGLHNYAYDAAGQLTGADNPGSQPDEAYGYDALGNRISGGYGGQHYDAANRLTYDNAYFYAYDNEGNLTTKTDRSLNAVTTYAWDTEHRLRAVTKPGAQSTSYRYDPLGRRIEVAGPLGTKRLAYGVDQNYPVEYDGSNNVAATYTFGLGMDTPFAMRRGGAVSYYQQDALGTVTSLSDAAGGVTQRYAYGAFGQPQTAGDSTGNPFTYTGRELDGFSGDYFYRARWYGAGGGRFTSDDRIRDVNRTSYSVSNPISLHDPTGEFWLADAATAAYMRGQTFATGLASASSGLLARVLLRANRLKAASEITFKTEHAVPHMSEAGELTATEVETAIQHQLEAELLTADTIGLSWWGRVSIQGETWIYRAYQFAEGRINVGTYYKP
ncbi:MAG: DUF11 domain-containing protein [Actinobacteria bacterium]|nr:DUF11 domain-containing protein [Actinomycetota bacterium]